MRGEWGMKGEDRVGMKGEDKVSRPVDVCWRAGRWARIWHLARLKVAQICTTSYGRADSNRLIRAVAALPRVR